MNNQKGLASIIIILIVVVLLAGGILAQQYLGTPEKKEEPYIEVLSPNGGENWLVGETYDISWESGGIDKININLIEYVICPPGALCEAPFSIDIASNISANLGKYSWTIPDYSEIGFYGSQFLIKILTIQPEDIKINDVSNNYFSIIEGEN